MERDDKVNRISLVGDIKDGGLKAPHLESIIKTHRMKICQRLADKESCNWKIILLHYLKQVGGGGGSSFFVATLT